MKRNKVILRIVVTLAAVLAITFWVGMSSKEVQAAVIEQPTPINEIFTDPVVADNVKTLLEKADVTDEVTQTDLDSITQLSAKSAGITTIEGMQYLTNLSELELTDNQITDVSPLANLTKITELGLSGNPLKDVSALAGLKSLKMLHLIYTDITDVTSLAGLTNLQELNLDINQITDISPLAALSNLQTLSLGYTQVSDLTPIANLSKLTILNAENCKVSDISPLASLSSLTEVYLRENQISDVSPLANIPNLSIIELTDQIITNQPVYYQNKIIVPNVIKGLSGELIAPDTISDNGTYTSPDLTWDLNSYINSVSYTFNQSVVFKNATVPFSGTVTQPLTEAYTAVFDVDGEQTSLTVVVNELIEEPTVPTKEGYTFDGWYDAETNGNKWDFAVDKMPASDITLYAKFTENEEPNASSSINVEPNDDNSINVEPDASNSITVKPTENNDGTNNPNSSSDDKVNIKLPITGDEWNVFPIFVGAVLIGMGLVLFRKKRQTK
ncbi:LPXTG cell wall anchor domain-containing protein [Listeria monocytogenes]|nr:LPXTG cell wall anchor domain-containing protein [Listeria monocytogenes]EDO0693361.1 LPXTG cell wall anchor domain-containing protein [Listeria monocytogenes]EDO1090009.1 LPXTG cell wall anchor domain-containing protein [Listeria monocytogenes]EJX1557056.1 leucine-rich repeat domain-containing protein [Listeria monocytogenes]